MEGGLTVALPARVAGLSSRTLRVEKREGSALIPEMDDNALITYLRSGEVEALGCLFRRYERVVRGIAARILRDSSEAEDLVQDFFLFIQRKCSIFDSTKSSAGSWIVHMAYQRAIERRRHLASQHFYKREDVQRSLRQVVGIATTENDYSPEAVFGRNGLEKVLSSLSEDQRETLRFFFFEGYTLAEISAKMGQSLANVRNHYYRGLDRVRKQMFARNTKRG